MTIFSLKVDFFFNTKTPRIEALPINASAKKIITAFLCFFRKKNIFLKYIRQALARPKRNDKSQAAELKKLKPLPGSM